jgi:hypothetical protein
MARKVRIAYIDADAHLARNAIDCTQKDFAHADRCHGIYRAARLRRILDSKVQG